jgi:TP901 family phage tail tape measure protein
LGETLAFDAILSAQNFLSGINQMIQGMTRAESAAKASGSSIGAGLAQGLGQKGDFRTVGRDIGNTVTQSIGSQFGAAGMIAGDLAGALGPVGIAAGVAGAALIGAGAAAVNLARAWETSMAGVSKTTGLTGADLATLSSELQNMSTTMPLAASGLANIAAVAGSLGVAKENIAGFTEAAAMMGVGFAMPADQAATAAAKILNSFNKPIDASNMMALGNVVNTLGDNFAATEPEILDFVNRASYLNSTFGMGIPAVAAWGTALISVGVSSETAATGIKSMMNLSLDPKKFDAFAEAAGMSSEDLRESLNKDVAGTYEMIAEKIAGGSDAVEKFGTISKLVGTEGMTVFTKMGGAAYQSGEALKKANAEWENGSSLMKTYETQSATLDSQWQIFTNTLSKAGTELGTVMLPVLTDTVKMMTGLTTSAMEAGEALGSMWGDFNKDVQNMDKGVLDFFGYEGTANKTADQMAYEASQAATSYTDEWGNVFEGDAMKGKLIDPVTEALGDADAKAALEKTAEEDSKTWVESFGGAMEAGMTQVADGVWKSWDAISNAAYGDYTNKYGQKIQGQGSSREYAEDVVGKTTIGGGEFILDTGNVLTLPNGATKYFDYNDPSSFRESIFSFINDWAETALTEENKAELFNDIQTLVRLKAKIEIENEWDVIDSSRSLSKFMDENKDTFAESGQELGLVMYNALNSEIVKSSPTLTESLANVMAALASPGSVDPQILNRSIIDLIDANVISAGWGPKIQDAASLALSQDFVVDPQGALKIKFEDIGSEAAQAMGNKIIEVTEQQTLTGLVNEYVKMDGDASNALIAAILAQDWAAVGKLMGEKTGEGYKDSLTGALLGEGQKNSLADIIAGASAGIGNLAKFKENTFLPALKTSFNDMYEVSKSGYEADMQIAKNWIEDKQKVLASHSDWFSGWQKELMQMYQNGEVTLQEFLDVWNGVENAAEKSATKTTEAAKKASVGYDNLKKTIEDCADCAISEFGAWQEAQDNLFSGSYIGEGGQPYLDWKEDPIAAIRETQQAMDKVGGAVLGKRYTGPEYDWVDENKKELKLTADDTDIKQKINGAKELLDTVQKQADPVKVAANAQPFFDQLQAVYDSIQPITIDVYYNEVNSPNWGETPNALDAGILDNAGWDTFPSYDSGTDYVPFDQFAKIHRGEAVLTPEENRARGSSGNVSVTIGPTIIEGDVNGVDDFEERMDRRDAELLKKMNAALKSMAKAA